jgi:ABC-type Fe3+ transport system permease subunit
MITGIVGIVIFPSKGNTSDIHDLIAVIVFLLMGIITGWMSSRSKAAIPDWNNSISYLGYSCSVSVVILAFLLLFWEYGPFIQKVTVILFNLWIVLIVYELENGKINSKTI